MVYFIIRSKFLYFVVFCLTFTITSCKKDMATHLQEMYGKEIVLDYSRMADIHFRQVIQVISRSCGMDIHNKVVVATVQVEGISKETHTFYTFTSSLTQMREWLVSLGVTQVAMESTGYIGNRYTTCSRISSATSGLSMSVTSRMFRVTRQLEQRIYKLS